VPQVDEFYIVLMKGNKQLVRTLLIAIVAAIAPAVVLASDLYRYINDEGNVVVDYQVPPEAVHRGYEILGKDGRVKEVVPRTLTPEERAALSEEEKAQELEQEEQARLQEWDESLMLRYSSIEDIEAARDRALRELRIRVSILKSNTRSLKLQIENAQAKAANIERGGGEVPFELMQNIDNLQQEIAMTDRSVVDREDEMEQVRQNFQKDIDRFQTLLDLVEARRARSVNR